MRAVGQFVRHRSNVALLIILAVGFGIRAFGLSQFAVTHWDEGDIWSGAVWFGTLGHNGRYHDQVSPPLPSVLFGVFAWPFGLNPRAAVWLSVLLGTASIGLMYLLVCRLASTRAALIASGLLALSGLHIMYSRSLLTEPFYVFFLLGALLSSMEYLRTRALKWVLLTAVSASCLQLTKYNGCLVALPLLTVLAYEIVTRRDQSDRARALRHSFLLGGLIAATIGANITALALSKVLPEFINVRRHCIRVVETQISRMDRRPSRLPAVCCIRFQLHVLPASARPHFDVSDHLRCADDRCSASIPESSRICRGRRGDVGDRDRAVA